MLLVTVPMAESLYKDTRTAFGIVLFGEPQYFAIGKIYFTCIPRLGRPGIMLGWPDDTVILDGDIMTFDDDITWTLGGNIILDGSICKLDWFINIIGTPITDCRIHGQFGQQIPVEHHLTDSAPTNCSVDPLLVAYSELDFHFVFDRLALASQQILRHLLTELPKAELSVDSSRLIFSFLVHFRSF